MIFGFGWVQLGLCAAIALFFGTLLYISFKRDPNEED